MNDIMDMKISGSSAMPGGEYRLVSISGSGKVQGSLRCESLRCSGSARVQGDVDCAGEIRCSGSSRVTGDIACQELGCSGSTRCEGSLRANGRVHSSGALKVDGSLEAESVHLTGSAVIQGLLNAETVEISASRGIRIGSIGGSSIRIYKPTQVSLLGLFHSGISCAQVGDIEGDDVDLEYTQADVVRGRRVRIGEGCSIGRVEYSESLDAWDGTVGESVCTGEGAQ